MNEFEMLWREFCDPEKTEVERVYIAIALEDVLRREA